MDENVAGCAGAILFVAMIVAPAVLTFRQTNNDWREELVNRGIAEWRIDAKTGAESFVYILGTEPKAEKE